MSVFSKWLESVHTAKHHVTYWIIQRLMKWRSNLPLDKRLDLKSHEQAAWINLHTPTVRQALVEAADKLQKTQRDIREFMIRPAVQPPLPRPPPV